MRPRTVLLRSGVAFQISLMTVLGVLVKIRVPDAQTSLEFVRIRYGKLGHLTFIVLNLVNNIVRCGSTIVPGSRMNLAAAIALISLGGTPSIRAHFSLLRAKGQSCSESCSGSVTSLMSL